MADEIKGALRERFLRISGYRESSITGSNNTHKTFTTDNGGKYQINTGGTKLTTLLGPDYPREKRAAPAEEA